MTVFNFAICQVDKSMFNKSKKLFPIEVFFVKLNDTYKVELISFHFIFLFFVVYINRNLSAYTHGANNNNNKKPLLNPIVYKVQTNTHI